MDYLKERNLFSKCCDCYDFGGMAGFEEFVDDFRGNLDEMKYLVEFRAILRISNSCAHSKISILPRDYSLKKGIEDLKFWSRHLKNESGEYLRIKLEEFFFKREHGELQ